jgi:hypothetical protein
LSNQKTAIGAMRYETHGIHEEKIKGGRDERYGQPS